MELKARVLVVGGGAVGGLFAWRLSLSPLVSVSLVCRSNYQQIKNTGYLINSAQFGSSVYRPQNVYQSVEEAAQTGPFDYVIVALKALPNIYDSSERIASAVNDQTMIILFQNGIGIEEPFVKRFPRNAIVSSVSFVSVKQIEDGVLKHGGFSMLAAGVHHHRYGGLYDATRRLEWIFQEFENQGVSCTVEADIQPYRWQKHILNGSTNPVSVICGGSSCQEMVKNAYCRKLIEDSMAEIFALGKRVTGRTLPGVDGIVDPQSATEYIESIPVPVYTSMLVDSQCKRPMERDVILKNPIMLADKYGVDVPHMKALYALVTMIEEGYSK
ncbi:hypothetical protein GGI07_004954 [Coemansia sp. Benny D115]|nr:hypothetical protein GGI07_004954 [Coemansia sp. Benny D115]